MKFRKKPVVIDAVQLVSVKRGKAFFSDCGGPWPDWANPWEVKDDHVLITTLEGEMRADPGDYIIRGIKGEFYPCKPDIFAATYEAA